MVRKSAFEGFGEPFDGGLPTPDEVTRAAHAASARAARPNSGKEKPLSVSEVMRRAKGILAKHSFRVVGEVSELSNKPGYKAVYFTIKDEGASLPCRMWANRFHAAGVPLALGAKVEITGSFDIFAPKGRMNFDVTKLSLAGEGDLRAKVARLMEKLRKEGLMAEERKRPLPWLPQTIGLVTSPNGAAVHDALRTLRRRYPLARVLFAGVQVEGDAAPQNLIRAMDCVVAHGAEVVLLVRGGGSYEDLMPFNDESLARAIALCRVPVVTGIGHEPDTTIADLVADVRASTPTHAAERVSPQTTMQLQQDADALYARMTRTLTNRVNRSVTYVDTIASRPLFKDPASLFSTEAQMVDVAHARLERAAGALLPQRSQSVLEAKRRLDAALPHALAMMQADVAGAGGMLRAQGRRLLAASSQQVASLDAVLARIGRGMLSERYGEARVAAARMNDLSPLRILERGWSIVSDEGGNVVRSVSDVHPDDRVKVQLSDGALSCRVEEEAVSELSGLVAWKENNE